MIRRSGMRGMIMASVWKVALLLACFLPLHAGAHDAWEDAREVVSASTREMIELLTDPSLKGESQFGRLFQGVDRVLSPVVDFDRIARGVMAKHYRKASDDQRQRFSVVFKGTLIKTYAKALSAFEIARYEISPNSKPSKKPEKQIVKVDVFGTNNTRYSLVYFMVKGDQGWKLTNVMLDGINLRLIFKNQFADAVNSRKGDIEQVITDWAQLVDSAEPKEQS